ncbi:M90 family metallopeptidase [Lacinutrix venerupis]|uniref:Peptidase n=1 Tax=Lacinutrix venerupis TaxID=1486034 RepID=A0AAC9LMJ5_9FLAO|nr:M90 family metallopeptidase [Lacinutrix venerupis]APY00125.1 peptidase [Lacinutrix venerupis]
MVYIIIFIGLVAFAVYAFTKTAQKKQEAFPKHWHKILTENVLFYSKLSKKNQKIFQNRMMLFFTEVTIDSVKIEIEELDRILIAASAIIPVFGFKEWHYKNLSGIILYPDTFDEDLQFDEKNKSRKILGMVGTGRFEKQMILSRKALRQSFLNDTDKHNTPVHEFVHLLDKMDGQTDGIPEQLLGKDYIKPWLELMHQEMEAINNNESDIRKYGGTSQAEFFAVASEYFFERPKLFKQKHPELYKMLSLCFQQPKSNS